MTSHDDSSGHGRRVILHTDAGRGVGTALRIAMTHSIVRTDLDVPIGAELRMRVPRTSFGELTLPATVRWRTGDTLAMQLGSLRARDVVALHRLDGGRRRDSRFALRRAGFRIDARIDPFARPSEGAIAGAGHPLTIVLRNGEIAGTAIRIGALGAILATTLRLEKGARIALRVPTSTWAGELELAATVQWSAPGAVGVSYERLRARDVWALHRLSLAA